MEKRAKIIIKSIEDKSIANEVGIEAGDYIIEINGKKIKDIFDYKFLITDEMVNILLEKSDGEVWDLEIEKDEYEDLGIEFDNSLIDCATSCTNNCIFCFIDQLPEGMRETLYFKDDDSRLSFLDGNYVTLTNMTNTELDRIISYHMSPINVSVHTVNPEIRISMLKNRFAGDVIEKIRRLVDAGITVNCQIVLCRDINDKAELDKSIEVLSAMYPGISSVSIVPVGLTKHRDNLFELKAFDKLSSLEVIKQVEECQNKLLNIYKSRVIYLADEFYLMAEIDLPKFEEYEDFPQIENGVGLIATLNYEFNEYLNKLKFKKTSNKSKIVSIVTGVSAYKTILELSEKLMAKYKNIKINVYAIKNNFFGENVTVTGLLCACDIIEQLKDKALGEKLLISTSTLKADQDIFLDNIKLEDFSKTLKIEVKRVKNTGKDLIESIINYS